MITLSDTQYEAFRRPHLLEFAQALCARARDIHPSVAKISEPHLLDIIEAAIASAHREGLHRRDLVQRFADLTVIFGTGFEMRLRWAQEAFDTPEITAPERLRLAEKAAIFALKDG